MAADNTTLQTSVSVVSTYNINEQATQFAQAIAHKPVTHYSGKTTLQGKMTNHEIASSVNHFVMYVKNGRVSLKVGDTTHPTLTNVGLYVYDGDTTNFYVSNPGTDPVEIVTVFAKN